MLILTPIVAKLDTGYVEFGTVYLVEQIQIFGSEFIISELFLSDIMVPQNVKKTTIYIYAFAFGKYQI